MKQYRDLPARQGLYDPSYEKDACGMGFVVNYKGVKSHDIIDQALTILEKLKHRGAEGADAKTGDGAGILVQLPHEFFCRECSVLGFSLPEPGEYGVGMIFAHRYDHFRQRQMAEFEKVVRMEGQTVLGWREVPIDESQIGEAAKSIRPRFLQVFIQKSPDILTQMDFERKLYVIRKQAEKIITPMSQEMGSDFYVASLSSRTIVYKGMLTAEQLRDFYLDLSDLDFVSALAMLHSRFSTNTFPSWARAHPNRYIVHNGEINTINGNINWINAREGKADSPYFPDMTKVFPVVDSTGSDSAMFDNSLEFLYMTGRSLPHAMMMMIPEPWEHNPQMSQEKRDFYKYHSFITEPWDGPAAMAFTDGTVIGGMLDRNGLRPSRYYVTKDDKVIMASEVGVVDEAPENIVYKGRLEPGKMLLIDTAQQRIISDDEIKHTIASEHPYSQWIKKHILHLEDLPKPLLDTKHIMSDLIQQQKAFGYTKEDIQQMIVPMVKTGKEPVGAMGADVPLAVLSDKPQLLYTYFKETFAQVTNPAIDGIREEIVTSASVMVGNAGNMMDPDEPDTAALFMPYPILTNEELDVIKTLKTPQLKTATLSMLYPVNSGTEGLESAIESMCIEAEKAIASGANILLLSDRGVNAKMCAIPALLATAALHSHLIRKNVRPDVGLILESAEPREVHHFCTLIGYGITAVNPYLALETIKDLHAKKLFGAMTCEDAQKNYILASVKGILKVMSKMGISTIRSYHGAQIFEALGIKQDLINQYFPNTPSRIEGIGIPEIAKETALRHVFAFDTDSDLEAGDFYRYSKTGEPHLFTPETIDLLQRACREGNYSIYKEYARKMNNAGLIRLRDLLTFVYPAGGSIPIEEVESVDDIVKRFRTGAMSYGALSKEAHECIAIAMNRIGGKSNCGEGGESAERFALLPNGDDPNDRIKQVSTARFGVTSEYLLHADELQIKCAQGAKPGEGGQLPGKKVYPEIARVRHSTPGVELISPPPHHDIYSIEDLAELIFDLKNVNRTAAISVKLAAGAGVGTIAAGVAKAKADKILISGYDGGTGAAPRTSIKNAGLPWELGIAETQQTLLLNKLRDRVSLEADGKLLTGRDVAVAALLGAEEFGFGTGPLIALGCKMLRVCNLNTCPFGVCTQDKKLREKFPGKPEHLMHFMKFIAQDLREIMARLGFRTLNEMIGRTDRLRQKQDIHNWKAETVSLDSLLFRPYTDPDVGCFHQKQQRHGIEKTLDAGKLVRMCVPAIECQKPVRARLKITNTHRVTGALLGSEITKKYGAQGLPEDTIRLSFVGSAGQSFGAFIPKGLTLCLEGDSNDYVGKGLSGGKIIVYPPKNASFAADENIIIGNVAFFGATSGEAYISGVAGERFAVRNSGITAVTEGVGDHGCEYMTGGTVVILGKTGRNFAAGMSGGVAYVLDLRPELCNTALVDLEPVADSQEQKQLKQLITRHEHYTGSKKAASLLAEWKKNSKRFTKVIPKDYRKMTALIAETKANGASQEEAEMAAFAATHQN